MALTPTRPRTSPAIRLTRDWIPLFLLIYGLWVILPWLAPVLMHVGRADAGKAIYFIYSLFCHQLPERSFFLFGRDLMYPLAEIQAAWQDTPDPMLLRSFIGNEAMGWKVAWSDRMISLYSTVWVAAVAWWPFRRKLKPLPWSVFVFLLLPITADGITHAVSDFSGLGLGFRDSNDWLMTSTNGALPWAYAGDALGSFNSWARLFTGALAGLGLVWFAFPHLERSFAKE